MKNVPKPLASFFILQFSFLIFHFAIFSAKRKYSDPHTNSENRCQCQLFDSPGFAHHKMFRGGGRCPPYMLGKHANLALCNEKACRNDLPTSFNLTVCRSGRVCAAERGPMATRLIEETILARAFSATNGGNDEPRAWRPAI